MIKILDGAAKIPKSARQASAFTAFVAVVLGLLNWGVGLVGGAILANRIGIRAQKSKIQIHYPMVCAAAYCSLLVWHGGFSGSAPLMVAGNDHFLMDLIGQIPIRKTILSSFNLINSILLIFGLPLICYFITPKEPNDEPLPNLVTEPKNSQKQEAMDQPRWIYQIEQGPFLHLSLIGLGLMYVVVQISRQAFQLDLNHVNFLLLLVALALHPTPFGFREQFYQSSRVCGSILIQFPLYGGIMAMVKFSGLGALLISYGVQFANHFTLPLWAFGSAAFLNLFVPSGGGQWILQGPFLMDTAQNLGVDSAKVVMAFAYGDQWSNMLQPFWALPLLAITQIRAREMIGFSASIMVLSTCIFLLSLLFI